ncbi:MAG: YbbR-like domain-containing protein [Bacteroidales bacterium]
MNPNLKIGKDVRTWAKEGRKWLGLLLSLLLAFFIWFLHNLSLEYSYVLVYNVQVTTNMEDRSPIASSKDMLMLRGTSKGFYILSNKFGDKPTIKIECDSSCFEKDSLKSNLYYLSLKNKEIDDKIISELSHDVVVDFFNTEQLSFTLPSVSHKKVPIEIKSDFAYDSQYMPVGDIKLKPDSVEIYGEESVISNINSIVTDIVSEHGIMKSQQGIAKLIVPRKMKLSTKDVFYSVEVQRYIENKVEIPIIVKNVPEGKKLMIFPPKVELIYRKPFENRKSYQANDFEYYIDYHDFEISLDSKVVPKLGISPAVFSYKLIPPYVECVLSDNNKEL